MPGHRAARTWLETASLAVCVPRAWPGHDRRRRVNGRTPALTVRRLAAVAPSDDSTRPAYRPCDRATEAWSRPARSGSREPPGLRSNDDTVTPRRALPSALHQ